MYNVCPKLNGLNEDIHSIFCEKDSLEENHWIYEDPDLILKTIKKLNAFLDHHDGINI